MILTTSDDNDISLLLVCARGSLSGRCREAGWATFPRHVPANSLSRNNLSASVLEMPLHRARAFYFGRAKVSKYNLASTLSPSFTGGMPKIFEHNTEQTHPLLSESSILAWWCFSWKIFIASSPNGHRVAVYIVNNHATMSTIVHYAFVRAAAHLVLSL